MILTLTQLCDKAANYLQSIKIGNKNANYMPNNSLKAGTTLKTYSFTILSHIELSYNKYGHNGIANPPKIHQNHAYFLSVRVNSAILLEENDTCR